MTIACVGLGSNLGDRRAHLALAELRLRAAAGVAAVRMSEAIETEPVGPVAQGRFLNAAAAIDTTLDARALLALLRSIEAEAGRSDTVNRVRWGPRELDLDILLFGDQVIDEPGLSVPHPRMHERAFVLEPLAQIAPDTVHPKLGHTVASLWAQLQAKESCHGQ